MESKTIKALWTIAGVSVANAGLTFVPSPGLEIPKHAALQVAEVGMCVNIAQIFSNKTHTCKEIIAILESLGGGAALSYGATNAGHALIKELLNAGGPPAWVLKSILGGSLTFAVGISFMAYCKARWESPLPLYKPFDVSNNNKTNIWIHLKR